MPRLNAESATQSGLIHNHEKLAIESNRIVHIGFGQFSRAHLAYYTEMANRHSGEPWRITAVNLNSPSTKRDLNEQDYLYTLTARDGMSVENLTIQVVDQALCPADGDRQAFKEMLISPHTKIVSLTVTEKGYCLNTEGNLETSHRDIQKDVENPDEPVTALGWLVWGINARKSRGMQPFAVLSLDNLNGNGRVLRRLVLELADLLKLELKSHVIAEMAFPCSMVDRIVPAVNEQQKLEVEALIGLRDETCVVTEQFSQWVLEEIEGATCPNWGAVGVELCRDVEPFERMKLRLLNGAHSALAYLGCLLDLPTVADCMADDEVGQLIRRLMIEEIQPQVAAPEDTDLDLYVERLLLRFKNPHLHHKVSQIAMDGSLKIPQRWLPVLEERLTDGRDVTLLSFCLACWIEYLHSSAEIIDPMAELLKDLSRDSGARGVIMDSGLFSPAIQQSELPRMAQAHLHAITTFGARNALADLMAVNSRELSN